MTRITDVHLEDGTDHEHIAEVKWINSATGQCGSSTTQQVVVFIEQGNRVVVGTGSDQVDVGVVSAKPKYVRTHADGKWTNNLLALPRY